MDSFINFSFKFALFINEIAFINIYTISFYIINNKYHN